MFNRAYNLHEHTKTTNINIEYTVLVIRIHIDISFKIHVHIYANYLYRFDVEDFFFNFRSVPFQIPTILDVCVTI
jgi:hypothetical protein